VKKEIPEWAINLKLNLTQLIQDFKELCQALPLPVLENISKFQTAQKELNFLRSKLEGLYKKRDRYLDLQKIIKETE
jgi:hypothetical protein